MKKLLFCLGLLLLGFVGCKQDIDPSSEATYIYVNNSSSEITVNAFVAAGMQMEEHTFNIPVKGTHAVFFNGFGLPFPFDWGGGGIYHDYLTVSNGEKIVTQKGADDDELYLMSSYIVLSEKPYAKTLLYVFTDNFFANGEPIK